MKKFQKMESGDSAMKRVSILGLGYIGIPTAIIAAECGYDVFGYDIDVEKINKINNLSIDMQEDEVDDRLEKAFKKKKFKVGTYLEYADCFIIAVPTPFDKQKKANLDHVFDATREIGKRLMPGNLVIVESTIPMGTTDQVAAVLEEISGLKCSKDFFVAHCPERVLPGKIFYELVSNDRVLGGICHKSSELALSFYTKFVKGLMHVTDAKTAETIKLIENSYRDVQIAFANQVASLCENARLDPYSVIDLANKHPRVKILSPSCGVGGHCIAVDPWFLINDFPQDTKLLLTARHINDAKPYKVIEKVLEHVKQLASIGKQKPNILGLGLTFKPDVNDFRESPALMIAQELTKMSDKFNFTAYDSHINLNDLAQLQVSFTTKLQRALVDADIIVILVKHKIFLSIPSSIFAEKVIIDTCGLLYDVSKKNIHSLLSNFTQKSGNLESATF